MKNPAGTMLIVFGVLMILGAAGLAVNNIMDSSRAKEASSEIAEELSEQIGQKATPDGAQPENTAEPEQQFPEAYTVGIYMAESEDPAMPVLTVDGYAYIGLLEIPDLDLSLPVMDRWDEERLKLSPCVYAGSYKTNDLVVCAHNYIGLFNDVRWIGIGAKVYLVTAEGELLEYMVTNIENLAATQVSDMIQNANNSGAPNPWDLTLFTCNTGGQTRRAIRCERLPHES